MISEGVLSTDQRQLFQRGIFVDAVLKQRPDQHRAFNDEYTQSYFELIRNVAIGNLSKHQSIPTNSNSELGAEDSDGLKQEVTELIEFEVKISKTMMDVETRHNVAKNFRKISIDQLEQYAPKVIE